MNYRHIFHAGNICDVVKHSILMLCLDYLKSKDKPFCVIDTHAGIGLYDLKDERALKTNEASTGILKFLLSAPLTQLSSYYKILYNLNPQWDHSNTNTLSEFHNYPGSPQLIFQSLRGHDRLIACELHPEDCYTLRGKFLNEKQVHVHQRDGYEALNAFVPPHERRGLVLIDPPFEEPDEFETLAKSVIDAYRKWPQGIFLLWYPIKERPAIWRFHETLAAQAFPKTLCAEFLFSDEIDQNRLNGSGCIIINPPWTFEKQLPVLFNNFTQTLTLQHYNSSVKWITP